MKVRIIKCIPGQWYSSQIGSIFSVNDRHEEHKPTDYYLLDCNYLSAMPIRKEDCEILPEEAPQPEPFDLERALKGEEMTSIDGREKRVYLVGKSNNIGGGCYILEAFYADRPPLPIYMTETDMRERLQMAPKQPEYKTVWVNLYEPSILHNGEFDYNTSVAYSDRIKCAGGRSSDRFVGTFPITFKVK